MKIFQFINYKGLLIFLMGNHQIVKEKKHLAIQRIREEYLWNRITEEYEALFKKLL